MGEGRGQRKSGTRQGTQGTGTDGCDVYSTDLTCCTTVDTECLSRPGTEGKGFGLFKKLQLIFPSDRSGLTRLEFRMARRFKIWSALLWYLAESRLPPPPPPSTARSTGILRWWGVRRAPWSSSGTRETLRFRLESACSLGKGGVVGRGQMFVIVSLCQQGFLVLLLLPRPPPRPPPLE